MNLRRHIYNRYDPEMYNRRPDRRIGPGKSRYRRDLPDRETDRRPGLPKPGNRPYANGGHRGTFPSVPDIYPVYRFGYAEHVRALYETRLQRSTERIDWQRNRDDPHGKNVKASLKRNRARAVGPAHLTTVENKTYLCIAPFI